MQLMGINGQLIQVHILNKVAVFILCDNFRPDKPHLTFPHSTCTDKPHTTAPMERRYHRKVGRQTISLDTVWQG